MTYKAGYTAWLLFCPVFLPEDQFEQEGLFPLPRYEWMGWLLDAAIYTQQGINFFVGLVNPYACGFLCYYITPLEEPFEIELVFKP